MAFDDALWDKVVKFHGHQCPGLAIGFRAAEIGMDTLGARRSEDEDLVTIVETDACGVDAIQVVTGCTLGKGNLILKNHGKQAFTFLNRQDGKGVRIYADPSRLAAVRDSRQKRMQAILAAPAQEFCDVSQVQVKLPEKAQIFGSARCASCGEKMGEPWTRLRNGTIVCLACSSEYSRGW